MSRPSEPRPPRGALVVGVTKDERPPDGQDMRLLRGLWPYVRPHLPLLGVALLLMPLTSAVALAPPYLIKLTIDAAIVERSSERLLQVAGLFLGVLLLEFALRFGQTYLMQLAGQRAMVDLRRAVFAHVQRLRISYFDRTPVGRVVTRVTNDIEGMSELFASGAVTAVADILTLVGIVAFMFYLDAELSLVAFAALPPLALLVNVFRKYAREAFRDIRARVAQLNAFLAEQVQGVATVQAFGREERCASEFAFINAGHRDANYRAIKYDALLYSVVESVAVITIGMVLYYASIQAGLVSDPGGAALRIGTIVAFYEYIQRFFVPIRDLSTKYTIIQSSLASAERVFGLLELDELDAPGGDSPAPAQRRADAPLPPASSLPEGRPPTEEALAFEHVSFAYRAGHDVLHDLSVTIRRGEKVAIVGATGSGKTTFTAVLLRLHEAREGRIRIDGRDARALSPQALRGQFAVVPQDVFLFTGTILENLALGESTPDPRRAEEALRRVGALEWVKTREGGLRARVEERGSNFSAGERQLLAFARAVYRDPPFLILDEATANVDSETEARLQAAVSAATARRTSIIVAHRLSTVRDADRILVFHHGRIVEEGSHDQLLSRDGVYARLHRLHMSAPTGAPAAAAPVPAGP